MIFKRLLIRFFCALFSMNLPLMAILDSISVSGNPPTLVVATPAAGNQPATVVNSTTTYGASTVLATRRITGQLSTNMPTGVTLQVNLQAPTGATSLGDVTLSTVATNLVTGVNLLVLQSGLQITYRLTATLLANPVTNSTVTVTFTLL